MTDYNDGLIHGWNGGDCPVHPESLIEYWLRGGVSYTTKAGECRWAHRGNDGDIIGFRVVEPHFEPKTIWVNEYKAGLTSYFSESEARRASLPNPIRIAVEYREVKK